jgi:hypothetical protein
VSLVAADDVRRTAFLLMGCHARFACRQNASVGHFRHRLLPDASPRASSGDLLSKGSGTCEPLEFTVDNEHACILMRSSDTMMIN